MRFNVEKMLEFLVLRFWPRAKSQIDLQAYYQARLLVVFSLLGSLVAIGFGFLFWFTLDSALGAAGFLIIGAGVGALPLVFRRTGSPRLCGHLLAFLVLTASAYVAIIRGGFPLNALLFVAPIPLITSYLVGRRGAVLWSAISSLTCVGLWLRAQTGHAGWRLVQPTAEQVTMVDLLGLLGLLSVMMVLAVSYEYARQMAESRRQEALERLAQSQRLESIGQLAGGVAHDFNNILTVIKGTADMVLSDMLSDSDLARDIGEIRTAAERASDLTNQLLLFSRRKAAEAIPLDLAACLEQLLPLLKRTLREDIQLEVEVAQGLRAVLLDRSQFEQVVLNLVSNAMDAMPAGGRLGIELVHLKVENANWPLHSRTLPEGHFVELRVRDTGQGMSAEQQEHIFEPFFTTKGPGFGTGLGLATVHGIVEQFSGHVWVESSPGAGSCFYVAFQRIEANSYSQRARRASMQEEGNGMRRCCWLKTIPPCVLPLPRCWDGRAIGYSKPKTDPRP